MILTFYRLSNHTIPKVTKRIPITFNKYDIDIITDSRLLVNITKADVLLDLGGGNDLQRFYKPNAGEVKTMLAKLAVILSERSSGLDSFAAIYEHLNKGFTYFQVEGLEKA